MDGCVVLGKGASNPCSAWHAVADRRRLGKESGRGEVASRRPGRPLLWPLAAVACRTTVWACRERPPKIFRLGEGRRPGSRGSAPHGARTGDAAVSLGEAASNTGRRVLGQRANHMHSVRSVRPAEKQLMLTLICRERKKTVILLKRYG
jgi:hypothetical protein